MKAIDKIDKEGIPKDADSKYYDVIYNGYKYPPKLVVSYANIFANGNEIDRNSFRGGRNTPCFNLLETNGFEIVEKMNKTNNIFYPELLRFIEQAKTDNLKTKHFISFYKEFEVKVSFGQGNAAKIPWISFLTEPNTTSRGIYPVFLYYKEYEILILAYGISETKAPNTFWKIKNEQSISDYFYQEFSKKPDRYGSSFVFKVYNVNDLPSDMVIENDLNMILKIYSEQSSEKSQAKINFSEMNFGLKSLKEDLLVTGLVYSNQLLTRFSASLLTKPFVILTGLSGSGKTKLAQAFVQWICQEESQYRMIPVGADWTNREPLLGYPNALKPEEYVKPDSGVLDLIIQANNQTELPHFLILDEMNLSHVERYFADFLSVMESKEEIPLYAEGTVENGVPAKLKVSSNLFIIGTVNIDETTNMFSPKVLDRANTIEFRVTKDEMEDFLGNIKDINMDALKGKGAGMAKSFLEMSANKTFETKDIDIINTALVQFFDELKKTGAEFGYRSATEILRLIHQLSVLDNALTTNQKIDIAIMQKLLPKLHGSRRKLCPVLETLGSFCIIGEIKIIKDVFEKAEFNFNGANVLYPLSLEKITRMYRGAIDNGFASFAEA
ncbi:MrcB family domain-containing protein [Paucihalobacter ruber]|uniref:MrcB family domain-containing protein n=1 Tax=Paucihalobacter ruber TaxID=2567861 RepID=UPI001C1EB8EC|nr:DUF3578 domain-containing protein [Paucihalobacter ruber]